MTKLTKEQYCNRMQWIYDRLPDTVTIEYIVPSNSILVGERGFLKKTGRANFKIWSCIDNITSYDTPACMSAANAAYEYIKKNKVRGWDDRID